MEGVYKDNQILNAPGRAIDAVTDVYDRARAETAAALENWYYSNNLKAAAERDAAKEKPRAGLMSGMEAGLPEYRPAAASAPPVTDSAALLRFLGGSSRESSPIAALAAGRGGKSPEIRDDTAALKELARAVEAERRHQIYNMERPQTSSFAADWKQVLADNPDKKPEWDWVRGMREAGNAYAAARAEGKSPFRAGASVPGGIKAAVAEEAKQMADARNRKLQELMFGLGLSEKDLASANAATSFDNKTRELLSNLAGGRLDTAMGISQYGTGIDKANLDAELRRAQIAASQQGNAVQLERLKREMEMRDPLFAHRAIRAERARIQEGVKLGVIPADYAKYELAKLDAMEKSPKPEVPFDKAHEIFSSALQTDIAKLPREKQAEVLRLFNEDAAESGDPRSAYRKIQALLRKPA